MTGRLIGLDWQKIESIWRIKKIDIDPDLVDQIELIETGCIKQDAANRNQPKS